MHRVLARQSRHTEAKEKARTLPWPFLRGTVPARTNCLQPRWGGRSRGHEFQWEGREGKKQIERRINTTGLDSESQFGLPSCPSAIRSHPCKFCCSSKPIRLQGEVNRQKRERGGGRGVGGFKDQRDEEREKNENRKDGGGD